MKLDAARRGRPRDPDLGSRIRGCALRLMLDHGFDKMTIDDVARAARVGKATIYRRWRSKEHLAYDALTAMFDLEVPEPDIGSYEEEIRQLYSLAIAFAGTPDGQAMIRLAISEALRDEGIAGSYREFLQRRIDSGAERLERARQRGEPIRADIDPAVQIEWLTGLLVIRVLTRSPMLTQDDVEHLVALTMRAVSTTAT